MPLSIDSLKRALGSFGRSLPGRARLDGRRDNILARYDAFYGGATTWNGASPPSDPANNKEAAERYFTLITEFFEYGWGDAFHMAPMRPGWSFKRSMAFWEQNFALHLGLRSGMRAADLGMGIGGPLRRLVEFTGADITGVTNCAYQVRRAHELTTTLPPALQQQCHYLEGDYNELPPALESNSFDVAYFMESLAHAEDRSIPLAEARRIVKPGGVVGAWQWLLKDAFDHADPSHLELKRGMEYGGGLRNLVKPADRHREFAAAGLEVLESWDMGAEAIRRGWLGWQIPLISGHDIPTRLTSSHFGRGLTRLTVRALEAAGIAEPGTLRTAMMLEHCGASAAKAGELGIFTPLWVTIGRKP